MKARSIGIAALAAILLIVLGLVFQAPTQHSDEQTVAANLVLPGLADALNDVAEVAVRDSSGSCTLAREGETWVLREKSDYPADMSKVRQLLIAAAELTLLDAKTSDPELYHRLGVQDREVEGAVSSLIEIQSSAGEDLGRLLVGKRRSGGGDPAYYVRRVGEAQSWLAAGNLMLRAQPEHWLDRAILEVKADRVREVETKHSDGERLVVAKADKTARRFDVQKVPKGRELRYATIGDGNGRALERLTMDDVQPAADVAIPDEVSVSTFRTFDGLVVEVRAWSADEKKWASFAVGFDERVVAEQPEIESAEDDTTEVEPPAFEPELLSADEARAEAEELSTRLSPWVFSIPSYAHDRFSKRMDDMLKELESEDA